MYGVYGTMWVGPRWEGLASEAVIHDPHSDGYSERKSDDISQHMRIGNMLMFMSGERRHFWDGMFRWVLVGGQVKRPKQAQIVTSNNNMLMDDFPGPVVHFDRNAQSCKERLRDFYTSRVDSLNSMANFCVRL